VVDPVNVIPAELRESVPDLMLIPVSPTVMPPMTETPLMGVTGPPMKFIPPLPRTKLVDVPVVRIFPTDRVEVVVVPVVVMPDDPTVRPEATVN